MKSMTGYGRSKLELPERSYSVEIKSVNHRYCDLNIKLPKKFNAYENNLRNIIKQDMSVDYRFYENINSNDLEFVLVSNHSNTIKRSRT